jgi:ribonuclease HI
MNCKASENHEGPIIVYADGSCLSNGFSGAKAGYGIYFGVDDPRNECGPVPGNQTNNRGEAMAVLAALRACPHHPLEIRTDSKLTIHGAQKLWRVKENLDLFTEIWKLLDERSNVTFTWVKGHSTDVGNQAADKLAKQGASLE